MKNNILILTLTLQKNYGGVLQAFALYKILLKLGYNPYVLREIPKDIKSKLKNWIDNKSHFANFRKNNIREINTSSITEKFLIKNEISTIVVGSDQIWRPLYYHIQTAFCGFLSPNSSIKRISYAASFGQDFWEYSQEETLVAKDLVKRFSSVSVREMSGVSLCKKFLSVDAIQVLDPTMLLDVTDYKKYIKPDDSSFVYVYLVNNKCDDSMVNSILKQTNKPIRTTRILTNKILKRISKQTTIPEWLSNIYNADYIITDSFHGCVFSILFNKFFYVIGNDAGGNTRIESLLNLFHLNKRFVNNMEDMDFSNHIDWISVNDKVEKYKDVSISFLKNALSE